MVGNLLRGTRIGEASGREIGEVSDADKRVCKLGINLASDTLEKCFMADVVFCFSFNFFLKF